MHVPETLGIKAPSRNELMQPLGTDPDPSIRKMGKRSGPLADNDEKRWNKFTLIAEALSSNWIAG